MRLLRLEEIQSTPDIRFRMEVWQPCVFILLQREEYQLSRTTNFYSAVWLRNDVVLAIENEIKKHDRIRPDANCMHVWRKFTGVQRDFASLFFPNPDKLYDNWKPFFIPYYFDYLYRSCFQYGIPSFRSLRPIIIGLHRRFTFFEMEIYPTPKYTISHAKEMEGCKPCRKQWIKRHQAKCQRCYFHRHFYSQYTDVAKYCDNHHPKLLREQLNSLCVTQYCLCPRVWDLKRPL